ncbi:uncharacterized protein [Pyxicephalus adspersus]|uniref:uncharacterized protein isoform X2 n=1 Tax=Pyxicephalus adspersus TaxID=30357 RepID=UPI003B5B925D
MKTKMVYEHRSRLERSLQKEKGEHKKTKEDYLVYKLEAQEALNKEKQDSMNRYGALSSQHKILKNQNEEIKKQLSDLQVEHSNLKLDHRKTMELQNQKLSQLQRDKDNEILHLQDTISKLREESKLLRKAHQDVHSQLLSAQSQIEEFRQLKDALKRMTSSKDGGTGSQNQHSQPFTKDEKPAVSPHVQQPPQHPAVLKGAPPDPPGAADKKTPTVNVLVAKEKVPVHSRQNIVSKVNVKMTKEEDSNKINANVAAGKMEDGAMHHGYLRRSVDKEVKMDAGLIDRKDGPPPQKQHVGQEALIPEDAADPAKDPNNQGEDEYEEAEIDRPVFEERVITEKPPKMDQKLMDERGGEAINGVELELVQDQVVKKIDKRN